MLAMMILLLMMMMMMMMMISIICSFIFSIFIMHHSSFMIGYHVHEKAIIIPMILQILACFQDNVYMSSLNNHDDDRDDEDRGMK